MSNLGGGNEDNFFEPPSVTNQLVTEGKLDRSGKKFVLTSAMLVTTPFTSLDATCKDSLALELRRSKEKPAIYGHFSCGGKSASAEFGQVVANPSLSYALYFKWP